MKHAMGYKNRIINKVLGNDNTSNALMSNNINDELNNGFGRVVLAKPRCVCSPLVTLLAVFDH